MVTRDSNMDTCKLVPLRDFLFALILEKEDWKTRIKNPGTPGEINCGSSVT